MRQNDTNFDGKAYGNMWYRVLGDWQRNLKAEV